MTRQSLESGWDKILRDYFVWVYEAGAQDRGDLPELTQQAHTALLKTVDRYVAGRERLARVDEAHIWKGAHTLTESLEGEEREAGEFVINNRIATLRQQVKGGVSCE